MPFIYSSITRFIFLQSAYVFCLSLSLEPLQVTVLRGENATARNLHSVVQSLESDKLKLELKVKNLEQKLREIIKASADSSGKTSSDPTR